MSHSHSDRRRRSRSPSLREDWRNVKVKDEPMSESEDRSGSKRSRSHADQRSSSRSHRDSSRDRNDRNHSSRDRDRDRSRHNNRRSKSRSRSSERESSRVRGQERRERDRGDRHIKSEPRSRSRSPSGRDTFARPPPRRPIRDDDDRRGEHRSREESGSRGRDSSFSGPPEGRPREPKREADWDSFFNPQSDMSQQAIAKRQAEDAERVERIRDSGPGGGEDAPADQGELEREKPNFGLSGKLTEETNTYRGVVIKYSEPPEARKPIRTRWRLYPFKDGQALEVMYVHRQSAYLLGRERKIADIPIDHPSCSKQHAVLQYRLVPYTRPNGTKGRRIRPYIIDLESANGTLVNGEKIQPKRYVELFEKDVLKFGFSSREYVLLHEHSKDDNPDDDEDGVDRSPSPD